MMGKKCHDVGGGESAHADLLAKCAACPVKGIDWASLLQQFGPMFLQVLLQILQRAQPVTTMNATADGGGGAKVSCTSEQLKCLDDCIQQQTECLCKLVEHRCCCDTTTVG